MVSKVLPAVQENCSLLSAKLSHSKHVGLSCDDLWLNICQKRDECDEKIKKMKGVAFFFSSVAAVEKRSKEKGKGETSSSQEQEDDQNDELPEKYWPAISYWIAVQSSNGMRVSTVPLHSALLQTGMEVTAKALPVCKRGKEEESCAPLCTTLKDHSNQFIQNKVDTSFSHTLKLLQDQLIEEPLEPLHATERAVRLQVVCNLFNAKLREKLIPSLVSSGLQFDVFGIEACHLHSDEPQVTKALASPIVVVMNDIERAMMKLGYALYSGGVFKKVKNSKYTYQHCCSVKKFLSLLGSNDNFKDSIIKHLNKLVEILGDKECEFMKQEMSGLAKLVLLERRKRAVEMQWVSMSQAQLINSIWCPLPLPCEEMEEDEDESLFITPSTATKAHGSLSTQRQKSQKRRSQQTAPPVPKRGRITHFFTSSQQ